MEQLSPQAVLLTVGVILAMIVWRYVSLTLDKVERIPDFSELIKKIDGLVSKVETLVVTLIRSESKIEELERRINAIEHKKNGGYDG